MPRPYLLLEATHRQLTEAPPLVAVLPWGATEAHNRHLPYGTDVIEATRIAERGAELAYERGARVVVLPTIPFGNDEQQLDQACTISFRTATAAAILDDVVRSLAKQGIDRLVVLNAHGGNQFQPLVRDAQGKYKLLIVVANFYQMAPSVMESTFEESGDHADEMETSLLLHLCPELVELDAAGSGERRPFTIAGLKQPGVWTPRPWSQSHPDTGSGNPTKATAEKGARCFAAVTEALAALLVDLAGAKKEERGVALRLTEPFALAIDLDSGAYAHRGGGRRGSGRSAVPRCALPLAPVVLFTGIRSRGFRGSPGKVRKP